MVSVECLADGYPDSPGRGLTDYFRWMEKTQAVPMAEFDPL
jgi:hypothetical protein